MSFRVVSRGHGAENAAIDRVSSLIAGTLAKRGLATHALGSLAVHRANVWLRERFPVSAARAVSIADNALRIECSHSIVLQELQAQTDELKRFLAAECPFASIHEVRLMRADGGAINALAPGNPPA